MGLIDSLKLDQFGDTREKIEIEYKRFIKLAVDKTSKKSTKSKLQGEPLLSVSQIEKPMGGLSLSLRPDIFEDPESETKKMYKKGYGDKFAFVKIDSSKSGESIDKEEIKRENKSRDWISSNNDEGHDSGDFNISLEPQFDKEKSIPIIKKQISEKPINSIFYENNIEIESMKYKNNLF